MVDSINRSQSLNPLSRGKKPASQKKATPQSQPVSPGSGELRKQLEVYLEKLRGTDGASEKLIAKITYELLADRNISTIDQQRVISSTLQKIQERPELSAIFKKLEK